MAFLGGQRAENLDCSFMFIGCVFPFSNFLILPRLGMVDVMTVDGSSGYSLSQSIDLFSMARIG